MSLRYTLWPALYICLRINGRFYEYFRAVLFPCLSLYNCLWTVDFDVTPLDHIEHRDRKMFLHHFFRITSKVWKMGDLDPFFLYASHKMVRTGLEKPVNITVYILWWFVWLFVWFCLFVLFVCLFSHRRSNGGVDWDGILHVWCPSAVIGWLWHRNVKIRWYVRRIYTTISNTINVREGSHEFIWYLHRDQSWHYNHFL